MSMKITKPTTYSIDINHRYIVELKKVRLGGLFNRVKVADAILFAKELAKAEASLWESVREAYPESIGKGVSVGNYEVTWDDTPNPTAV